MSGVEVARGVGICQRSVTNLLDRYDERICLRLADSRRWRRILREQGRVILALDGLQPDVGHEVLCVLRDWRTLREDLEKRRSARVLRCRFRRHSRACLRDLEDLLRKSALPP